jgi:predicted metal-binding membrane protein
MAQRSGTGVLEEHAGPERERAFFGISALILVASVGGTIYQCRTMSGSMTMPGGWTMSMVWMRMSGQSWPGAAASFLATWVMMMVAMMLPSLMPMLLAYRRSVRESDETRLSALTALVGAGYFAVWVVFGAAAYLLGVVSVAAELRWSALSTSVPITIGIVLLLAGCVQLTVWKARQLEHCRNAPACGASPSPDPRSAWEHGLRLGMHCSLCCSSFMLILLATGVMDLGTMAIVTTAITVERLGPSPARAARYAGVVVIAAGALVIARALVGA